MLAVADGALGRVDGGAALGWLGAGLQGEEQEDRRGVHWAIMARHAASTHVYSEVMGTALELSLREKIRRALLEEIPAASDENIERALTKIMTAVDPFERAAADVLQRYDRTFAELAK